MNAFDDAEKRFATLQASFALSGYAVIKARRGDAQATPFYAARWGWSKPLASLDAADRFLRTLRGAR